MKIEDRIKQHLSAYGKVVVPNLGTFVAGPSSARIKGSQGVLHPPTLEVTFSDEVSEAAEDSIEKWLLKEGDLSADELQYALEGFTKGLKNNVALHGKSEIKGLGYFIKDSTGGLGFIQDEEVVLGPDNFGLPKIEAKPLTPALVTDKLPEPSENNKLLMAAIAIPLVVFFCMLIYFLTNRPAYEKLVSYFSGGNDIEMVERQEPTAEEIANRAKLDSIKAAMEASAANETAATEAGNKGANTSEKPSKATESKTTNPVGATKTTETKKADKPATDTGASTDLVVNSKTGRFYVIAGSFGDEDSAKKAVAKFRKIGYATAKVVNVGGRIRVSLQDFANKPDASEFASKAGKDYAGAWVFAN